MRTISGPPIVAVSVPLVPLVATTLRRLQRMGLVHVRPDLRRGLLSLQDLQGQSERGVKGDVAVHEPIARVVGLEGDHDVSVCREQHNVAPRRIIVFQV